MADLGDTVRETFSEYSADVALETVQSTHKIKVPSLNSALPLLDLHGMKRRDFHSSLLSVLSGELQERLPSVDNKTKEKLLDNCFTFIEREDVLAIIMKILKSMSTIPDKYLSYLSSKSEDEQLYSDCPIEVKRKLWEYDSRLFGETVSPLLDQYVADKEEVLYGNAPSAGGSMSRSHKGSADPLPFFFIPSKQRRDSPVIRNLANMVGSSINLFHTLVQFLRTLYLRTHVSHYCTLRADLTMALHDGKVTDVLESDPCYKFTWCLDACINIKGIDAKKLRELLSILDSYADGSNEILGDISMVVRDPYALHCIALSVVKCVQHLLEKEKLPRESPEVVSLVRLLDLGLKSWDILDQQDFVEDKLDVSLAIKFLPELMSFMVDGTLHQVLQKLKEPTTMPFTTSLKTYISKQQPMLILCSYTCVLAEQKDFSNLVQLLPMIASVFSTQDVQLPDGFIHHIGLLMCGAVDAMQDSHVRTILREFYLPCSCSDEGFLYACHYLCLVSEKVDKEFLDEVLGLMETESQRNDLLQEHYQALLNRIHSHS